MTRNLSLTATLLVASCMTYPCFAANSSAVITDELSDTTGAVTIAITADSLATEQEVATNPFETETDHEAKLVIIDDETYILNDGTAYALDDIRHNFSWENNLTDAKNENVVPVIAICFIVPCVTIVIVLVLLLMFFMRRTQEKNRIIEHAIDAGYQLPDSFYSNQTSYAAENYVNDPIGSTTNDSSTMHAPRYARQNYPRDPKKFSSAITLIAVGIAVLMFLGISARWSVAFLAGGIPLLLGIGNLIGYFFIPGYSEENTRKNGYTRNNYNGTPYQQDPTKRYPDPRYPDSPHNGSYPPPFNRDEQR